MADLAQHALEYRADFLLVAAADLAEPERAQRAAMPLALADLAPDLGDLHLGHQSRVCFGWSSSRMTVFLSRLATPFFSGLSAGEASASLPLGFAARFGFGAASSTA